MASTSRVGVADHPGPKSPWILYWVGRVWMWVFGWQIEGQAPQVPKGILIAAPHTSNWDLPHMLAASFVFRLRVSWLGKHTLFKGPFGPLFRALGGLPIDRRSPHGAVKGVADLFTGVDRLMIAVPPSGTRSKREYWKSGFYWIALTAEVPVVFGYLDYERRRAGLGTLMRPTGDIRADMDIIRAFYADKRGKNPESESRMVLKEEEEGAPRGHPETRAAE